MRSRSCDPAWGAAEGPTRVPRRRAHRDQVLTLKDFVDDLGFANTNAEAIFDVLEAGDGFAIFMSTKWGKSRAADLAGLNTHIYNPDQRIIQIQDGEFVDVGGGWVDGFMP